MTRPTMGTSASQVTPAYPDPAHTTTVAKQGSGKSDAPDNGGTATHRKGAIERLGASYAPRVNYVYPNQPEASQTLRNVRIVPSAVGNRDFWNKRQYGQDI